MQLLSDLGLVKAEADDGKAAFNAAEANGSSCAVHESGWV